MTQLAFLSMPSGWEWFALLAIGLLIFGKRLPEVGRSLGRGIVEFKRGVRGFEEEIEQESRRPGSTPAQIEPTQSRTVSQSQHAPAQPEPQHRPEPGAAS